MKFIGMIFAAVMLVGCTPANTPAPSPSVVQVDNDAVFDQAFVKAYQQEFGSIPTNDVVLTARQVGQAACKVFESGGTADDIVKSILSQTSGDGTKLAIIATGVGVGVYCPQYVDMFK